MPEDAQVAGDAQVGDGAQPELVTGKRQRKSVDFFAPAAIHTTEKLAVQQVGAFTTGYWLDIAARCTYCNADLVSKCSCKCSSYF